MLKREAIQALLDGKKVRHESWEDGAYFCMSVDGNIYNAIGYPASFIAQSSIDWEIYEEPEPKKIRKFVVVNEDDAPNFDTIIAEGETRLKIMYPNSNEHDGTFHSVHDHGNGISFKFTSPCGTTKEVELDYGEISSMIGACKVFTILHGYKHFNGEIIEMVKVKYTEE